MNPINPMNGRDYDCALCGEHYTSPWSNEEAVAEFEAMKSQYVQGDDAELAVVCDPCYRKMAAEYRWQMPDWKNAG